MFILNFSHPLTSPQKTQLEELIPRKIERLVEIMVQLDEKNPIAPQITSYVEGLGLSSEEWQTGPLLVNLPGYAPAAACVLAEVEGRCGHLPSIIKLRPLPGLVTEFEVGEIVNLKMLRDEARRRR